MLFREGCSENLEQKARKDSRKFYISIFFSNVSNCLRGDDVQSIQKSRVLKPFNIIIGIFPSNLKWQWAYLTYFPPISIQSVNNMKKTKFLISILVRIETFRWSRYFQQREKSFNHPAHTSSRKHNHNWQIHSKNTKTFQSEGFHLQNLWHFLGNARLKMKIGKFFSSIIFPPTMLFSLIFLFIWFQSLRRIFIFSTLTLSTLFILGFLFRFWCVSHNQNEWPVNLFIVLVRVKDIKGDLRVSSIWITILIKF